MRRPTSQIENRIIHFEPHGVIDDRAEVFDADLAVCWELRLVVRCADDLSMTITTAGQQDALSLWPVISPGVVVSYEFSFNGEP